MRSIFYNTSRQDALELGLGEAINSGPGILHAPSLGSSILSSLDICGNRPDRATLSHVESTHGLLISGQLICVENTSRSDKTRVSILFEPLGANFGSGTVQDTFGRSSGLFNGLELLLLAGFVVRSRRESKSLPDAGHLGGSQVGFSNERKVDGDSWEVIKSSNGIGFLLGTVHLVSETILVQSLFKTNLGDAFLTKPCIVERVNGTLEEAKVYQSHDT